MTLDAHDCLPACEPSWRSTSARTDIATDGTVYQSSSRPDDSAYEDITRFGRILWQCSTESVC